MHNKQLKIFKNPIDFNALLCYNAQYSKQLLY